ncbi:MAG: sialate O-acetylesterase [Rariglobus sp.]
MKWVIPIFVCALLTPLSGAVSLAPLFSDGAVLQREKPVPIWGTASAGEKITVTFAGQSLATTADTAGRWRINLAALPASDSPRELVVKGTNTLTIRDVVVGEVWLASGQSNMEWPLSYVVSKADLAAINFPLIRQFKTAKTPAHSPASSVEGTWAPARPTTAGQFSAVAYYFALELNRRLNVPVGILNSSWGGTGIDPWIAAEAYSTTPELAGAFAKHEKVPRPTADEKAAYETLRITWEKARDAAKATKQPFTEPAPKAPAGTATNRTITALNNGMIAPLAPYALRGAIWYQGESNTAHASGYALRMSALISGFRTQFAQPHLPVYWVQLPNFDHGNRNSDTWHWAELREAQTKTLAVPHTGQAITIDVGEPKGLHPKNKKPVGERLALLALARTYAVEHVVDSGPVFKSAIREGAAYRISYEPSSGSEPALSALKASPAGLTGFELAGADQVFHPADARIDGATVIVTSAQVANPVAVRYAYRNAPVAGLFNSAGLPAAPFRTDTWPAPKATKSATPPPPIPES